MMSGIGAEKKEITVNVDFTKGSSFTGRSSENGIPVTAPLKNLEEALSWKADDTSDLAQMFSVATIPFLGKLRAPGEPKNLVCHDMKGGYINDRFVQGCKITNDRWYLFTNWDVVDTFVYFSHHFVTIPPVGWINAAHKHGVAVLGTLITEGDDGKQRWKAILSSQTVWERLADQLVAISKYYGFEGWLLNVENTVNTKDVNSLVLFVKYLYQKIKIEVTGAEIIWYDSLTISGNLAWQNELNDKNRVFFDACGGIFLNYFWSKQNLLNSETAAQDRKSDVYVGIDVFGRSTYGGGGLNSAAALDVIQNAQLSTAVFAPGWVKEVLGEKRFLQNEKLFWDLLGGKMSKRPVFIDDGFATGLQMGIKSNYFSLSQQDFLPMLSSNNTTLANATLVISDANTVIYRLCYFAKSGSKSTLKIVDFSGSVALKLIVRQISVKYESRNAKAVGDILSSTLGYENIDEDCCDEVKAFEIVSTKPGTLYSLTIGIENSGMPKFETVVYPINVSNISWKKGDETKFILSCVLNITDPDKTINSSNISYCCIADIALDPITGDPSSFPIHVYKYLGYTACSKYCISDLEIPNPMFYGCCKVVLKAVHLNTKKEIVGNSEIVINYAENLRE